MGAALCPYTIDQGRQHNCDHNVCMILSLFWDCMLLLVTLIIKVTLYCSLGYIKEVRIYSI